MNGIPTLPRMEDPIGQGISQSLQLLTQNKLQQIATEKKAASYQGMGFSPQEASAMAQMPDAAVAAAIKQKQQERAYDKAYNNALLDMKGQNDNEKVRPDVEQDQDVGQDQAVGLDAVSKMDPATQQEQGNLWERRKLPSELPSIKAAGKSGIMPLQEVLKLDARHVEQQDKLQEKRREFTEQMNEKKIGPYLSALNNERPVAKTELENMATYKDNILSGDVDPPLKVAAFNWLKDKTGFDLSAAFKEGTTVNKKLVMDSVLQAAQKAGASKMSERLLQFIKQAFPSELTSQQAQLAVAYLRMSLADEKIHRADIASDLAEEYESKGKRIPRNFQTMVEKKLEKEMAPIKKEYKRQIKQHIRPKSETHFQSLPDPSKVDDPERARVEDDEGNTYKIVNGKWDIVNKK